MLDIVSYFDFTASSIRKNGVLCPQVMQIEQGRIFPGDGAIIYPFPAPQKYLRRDLLNFCFN